MSEYLVALNEILQKTEEGSLYTKEDFFKYFKKLNPDQLGEVKAVLIKANNLDYMGYYDDYVSKKDSLFEGSIHNGNELLALDIPPVEWHISKLIPKRGVTYIGGDSGALKSLVAQHLLFSMATKERFLGEFPIEQDERPLVYLDEENRLNTLKARYLKLRNGINKECDLSRIKFIVDSQIKLDANKDKVQKVRLALLEEKLDEINPQIIVFDSFIRFFEGDENFSTDVRKVFETIKRFMLKYDCAIIILHHTGKSQGNNSNKHSLRGSGEISASADVVLLMKHNKQYSNYVMSQEKNRHDEEVDAMKIKLVKGEDSLNVVFDGYIDNTPSTVEQIKDEIKKWIDQDSISQFKTKEVKDYLMKLDFKIDSINKAISGLLEENFIERVRNGLYKVPEYQKIIEESVVDE